jgi:hypothetical protein
MNQDAVTKPILRTFAYNLDYARRLVADVPDEKMAYQPAPKTNHAIWCVGHLIGGCDFAGSLMGLSPSLPKAWEPLFGWNAAPQPERSAYPSKAEVLQALEAAHAKIADAFAKFPLDKWADPFPIEQFRKNLPTVGDALVMLLTSHEATHLGQLSAWRRVQGMPSV